ADVGCTPDVAEPDIAARGFDLCVAADLVQIQIARGRLRAQLAEAPASPEIGRSGLGAESRALGRPDTQADVELSQEAKAETSSGLHLDDDFVAAAGLAELDPRVVEKLADLVGAAAGVELDLGGRAGPGLDVDAPRGNPEVERHIAGGFERLAPHDRRPRTRRITSRAPGRPSLRGSREATRPALGP